MLHAINTHTFIQMAFQSFFKYQRKYQEVIIIIHICYDGYKLSSFLQGTQL